MDGCIGDLNSELCRQKFLAKIFSKANVQLYIIPNPNGNVQGFLEKGSTLQLEWGKDAIFWSPRDHGHALSRLAS